VHPNPAVAETLTEILDDRDNVLLTEPLGYATFSRLLARSTMVITDSGGVQEEAPSLGKPVLVTRESTERTEGIEAGTLRLVGTDSERIAIEGRRLLEDPLAYEEMAAAENPYGDGEAAQRVVAALEHILLGGEAPTQFGPGYDRSAIAEAAGFELAPGEFDQALKAAHHRMPAPKIDAEPAPTTPAEVIEAEAESLGLE
jgi:UDP-N-acetylglucosamine 2-epimerase (non-hydrolysing)